MARRFQLRRGTNAENTAFTGAIGEITYDTNNKMTFLHDGSTVGGIAVGYRANSDGTVTLLNRAGVVLATLPASGLFVNTLTSTATNQALTAAQGKVLQDNKLDINANAVSATKLFTARSINGVNFDGTANIIVPASSTNLLTTGTDLNTITTVGFYACSISSTANTFLNCPTNMAFGLLVTLSAGCIQELTEYNTTGTPKTFKRHMYAGAWGAWYEVLTTLNPDTTKLPLTGGTLTGGLSGTTANFSSTANFTGQVTLGNGLNSAVPISFLNTGTAQKINTGGVLISNQYTDANLVPANGMYSKGNITSAGTILGANVQSSGALSSQSLTVSGAIAANSGITVAQSVTAVQGFSVNNAGGGSETTGYGIGLYGTNSGTANSLPNWGFSLAGTTTYGNHGAVTGQWAVYNVCNNAGDTRGWIFKNASTGTGGNVASISTNGVVTAASFVGDVNANTVIANTITGSLTGNATSADKLSSQYGSAPSYAARAWGALRGTGTVALLAGGNILSITDNGVGDYTVSFITPMPTATYAVVFGNVIYNGSDIGSYGSIKSVAEKTVNGFRIAAGAQSYVDLPEMYIGVFH